MCPPSKEAEDPGLQMQRKGHLCPRDTEQGASSLMFKCLAWASSRYRPAGKVWLQGQLDLKTQTTSLGSAFLCAGFLLSPVVPAEVLDASLPGLDHMLIPELAWPVTG
ncbi:hypothetical protein HJG60_011146 [Phyllostomus discolor]|nr:hypothetical protein HJG60_011146 [Phyllostomus discolor]